MFYATMMEGDNCKRLLEIILQMSIKEIQIDYEKTLTYHPDYHGIRLDIIAEDEDKTHYNVEMQVSDTPLVKRSRYYHSQIDMGSLLTGQSYDQLPETYVIFICDYDPFGYGKYQYTQESYCPEEPRIRFHDGSHTIYLSTHGKNPDQVPGELVKFLDYVRMAPIEPVVDDDPNSYIQTLQNSIYKIKADRSMEERFMLLEEMMRQERKTGMEEGIEIGEINTIRKYALTVLKSKGYDITKIERQMQEIKDKDKLDTLFQYALTATNIDEVEALLQSISE